MILNADDFGLSEETVDATIECFERGALTSATIMPNAPATDRAVEFGRAHPEFSFGVHLTLVGEGEDRPVSPSEAVPGLVGSDGALQATNLVRLRALLRRLDGEQLDREVSAQLSLVRDLGVPISHVDSHRHLHKFGAVLDSLARVLPSFGLTRVRNVQDVYIDNLMTRPTYLIGRLARRRLTTLFATTDHFFMSPGSEKGGWEQPLLERVRKLPGRTLEIGVHPGFAEPWRNAERRSVQALVAALSDCGHELVSWRAIGRNGAGTTLKKPSY